MKTIARIGLLLVLGMLAGCGGRQRSVPSDAPPEAKQPARLASEEAALPPQGGQESEPKASLSKDATAREEEDVFGPPLPVEHRETLLKEAPQDKAQPEAGSPQDRQPPTVLKAVGRALFHALVSPSAGNR